MLRLADRLGPAFPLARIVEAENGERNELFQYLRCLMFNHGNFSLKPMGGMRPCGADRCQGKGFLHVQIDG